MTNVNNVAADRLKSFIERIERLNEELDGIKADVKEVYSEAKGEGYDAKIIKMIVAIRKRDKKEIQEEQAVLDVYLSALGETL